MSQIIKKTTLDDLLRSTHQRLLCSGETVCATKGNTIELRGVLLELSNPRARLSRSETRGLAFSPLGELCWYLSGSECLEFIEYYIPKYRDFIRNDKIHGAYGPRLMARHGSNSQLDNIIAILKCKPTSRQAVIQLFDSSDIATQGKDVPCTCTLQFLLRDGRLDMITNMRSNDAFVGLPHDVFCFTMIQELVARSVSAEIGVYRHFVGSLHIYSRDKLRVEQYLKEGYCSTTNYMPSMPIGDPFPSLEKVLSAEKDIRMGRAVTLGDLKLDRYWADVVRLLQVYGCSRKRAKGQELVELAKEIDRCYSPYIEKLLERES